MVKTLWLTGRVCQAQNALKTLKYAPDLRMVCSGRLAFGNRAVREDNGMNVAGLLTTFSKCHPGPELC
jgi:hypothetical protein